mmetsp:Transcript_25361/g.35059  ORF Transcript_25361/g.35059 Transcript_25361/m.35059 type:complete len:283 (+) Transcript_25361:551-1399(+)
MLSSSSSDPISGALLVQLFQLEQPRAHLHAKGRGRQEGGADGQGGLARRGAGRRRLEQEAGVEAARGGHQVEHVLLLDGQPLEGALGLHHAHPQLQVPPLHAPHGVLQVRHAAGLLHHRHEVRGAKAGLLPPGLEEADGRGAVPQIHQLLQVGLRQPREVVGGVQALADAVQRGERPEDEGEAGGELEGHVAGDGEQVAAQGQSALTPDLFGLLLVQLLHPLPVLGVHRARELRQKVPRDLLHADPVHPLPQDAHLLQGVAGLLGVVLVDGEDQVDQPRAHV